MSEPISNLLLTGPPGCGKTIVIRRVVELLHEHRLAGFYTQEIRQHGERVGFEAVGLGGQSATLAHVDFHSRHRVGRYGVDLDAFEAIVTGELTRQPQNVDLFVVDEIGRMECLSRVFTEAGRPLPGWPGAVLATIAARGGGIIAQVRARQDVEVLTVTAANRERLPDELVRRIRSE